MEGAYILLHLSIFIIWVGIVCSTIIPHPLIAHIRVLTVLLLFDRLRPILGGGEGLEGAELVRYVLLAHGAQGPRALQQPLGHTAVAKQQVHE